MGDNDIDDIKGDFGHRQFNTNGPRHRRPSTGDGKFINSRRLTTLSLRILRTFKLQIGGPEGLVPSHPTVICLLGIMYYVIIFLPKGTLK